jgi:hypothetical protein
VIEFFAEDDGAGNFADQPPGRLGAALENILMTKPGAAGAFRKINFESPPGLGGQSQVLGLDIFGGLMLRGLQHLGNATFVAGIGRKVSGLGGGGDTEEK